MDKKFIYFSNTLGEFEQSVKTGYFYWPRGLHLVGGKTPYQNSSRCKEKPVDETKGDIIYIGTGAKIRNIKDEAIKKRLNPKKPTMTHQGIVDEIIDHPPICYNFCPEKGKKERDTYKLNLDSFQYFDRVKEYIGSTFTENDRKDIKCITTIHRVFDALYKQKQIEFVDAFYNKLNPLKIYTKESDNKYYSLDPFLEAYSYCPADVDRQAPDANKNNNVKIKISFINKEGFKKILKCLIKEDDTIDWKYYLGNLTGWGGKEFVKVKLDQKGLYIPIPIEKLNQGISTRQLMEEDDSREDVKQINRLIKGLGKKNNTANNEVVEVLKQAKQIILQGPPGTGKTRMAKILACNVCNKSSSKPIEMGNGEVDNKFKQLIEKEQVKIVQFHSGYRYDDFVIGIDVHTEKGNLKYEIKEKIIYNFANKAKQDTEGKPYVLIIDEINRAPLASVLGELLYALEYRGENVVLQHQCTLNIPDNLYIVGTMNTADRSITDIDYAVRRRFAFVSIPVEIPQVLEELHYAENVFEIINKLFDEPKNISKGILPDDVRIGTSYFIYKDREHLEYKVEYEIIPILKEYYKDGILTQRAVCDGYQLKDVFSNKELERDLIEYILRGEEGNA